MKDSKVIYVVTMRRHGYRNNHSYVLFAGHKKQAAIGIGEKEEQDRGGKYRPEVVEFKDGKKKYIVEAKEDARFNPTGV